MSADSSWSCSSGLRFENGGVYLMKKISRRISDCVVVSVVVASVVVVVVVVVLPFHNNKAVIGRRLRPRCCHLGSYFKRPESSSPVRPLACDRYYCARLIAKPKAACALRISWAATSSNLGLCANMTSRSSSIKSEVHNVSPRHEKRTAALPM